MKKDVKVLLTILISLMVVFSITILKKGKLKNVIDREKGIIDEYHRQVVLHKGNEYYFIPNSRVSHYYDKNKLESLDKMATGDILLFFNKNEDIIYRASIVATKGGKYIECLNLKSIEYYLISFGESENFVNEIIDLDLTQYSYAKVAKNKAIKEPSVSRKNDDW